MTAITTFMDLPIEIHFNIVDACVLHPVRIVKPDAGPLGRHGSNGLANRHLRCGSLRDLPFVNRYFRELTAPYLWESICIDDRATATVEDKLQNAHKELGCQRHRLQHIKKLIISLGRTPNPPRPYGREDFIEMLRMIQDIEIMRYVMENQSSTYTILPSIKKYLAQYQRGDVHHRPLHIFKVKQLELSCPWGSHNWDFGHLTWPYPLLERLWLDFNIGAVQIPSLALQCLPSLRYVMHRTHPVQLFYSDLELEAFAGFARENSWRGPYLTQLADSMPQVKHFAMCGVLKGPVTDLVPSLQRICFVRDQIGTLYHAIRDADTGKLEHIETGETIAEPYRFLRYTTNQAVWRCGFPNLLNYNLRSQLEGCSWIRGEDAFWLDTRYQSGDESVVPHHLLWDVAERHQFGTMPPDVAERMDKWIARRVDLDRERAQSRRWDAYIRS